MKIQKNTISKLKMNENKMKLIVLILMFCLLLAVVYIAFDKYSERKIEKESYIFQQGVQYGYNQTIIGIVQQAITCEPVSLNIENSTFELIAIKCLNQA